MNITIEINMNINTNNNYTIAFDIGSYMHINIDIINIINIDTNIKINIKFNKKSQIILLNGLSLWPYMVFCQNVFSKRSTSASVNRRIVWNRN